MAGFESIFSKRFTQNDMQSVQTKYNENYNKEFGDLIDLLKEVLKSIPNDKDKKNIFLLLSLPAINNNFKKLLSEIKDIFKQCANECTSIMNPPKMKRDKNNKILEQLKALESSDAYAYAQVCKAKDVKQCIQFMTLVALFETLLFKVNKLVELVPNKRTPSGKGKSIRITSPNISRASNTRRHNTERTISLDSSNEIKQFKKQYNEFLEMISRKTKGGKRRTKKNLDF